MSERVRRAAARAAVTASAKTGRPVHPAVTDLAAPLPNDALTARLKAFARDCVTHGDMTPSAARMLNRILDGSTP